MTYLYFVSYATSRGFGNLVVRLDSLIDTAEAVQNLYKTVDATLTQSGYPAEDASAVVISFQLISSN